MSTAASSLERAFRDAAGGAGVALGVAGDPDQLDLLRDAEGKLPGNVFQLMRRQAKGRGRPPGATNKRNAKLAQMICQEHGDPVLFMASVYSMPLDQLAELLRIADGSAEQEARLTDLAERLQDQLISLVQEMRRSGSGITAADGKLLDQLTDRLQDMAKLLKSKPGHLAVQALALQIQSARASAEYVHGKMPVQVDLRTRSDVTLLVPGLNMPLDGDQLAQAQAIADGGFDIDADAIELIPPSSDDGDGA